MLKGITLSADHTLETVLARVDFEKSVVKVPFLGVALDVL